MTHNIPLGTHVAFEGGHQVYVVDNYQTLLGPCPPDCSIDHDCFEEPYITVRQQSWTAFPLSKLRYKFGEDGVGIEVDPKECINEDE